VLATGVGCVSAWIGLLVPALRALFDYAWFVGGISAATVYYALMTAAGARRVAPAEETA
jgi:NCS1 family nucleobase:cation symporter-1